MLQEQKIEKVKIRVTKPVRVDHEWHLTLKIEAANRNVSITRLLDEIIGHYFFRNDIK